MLPYGSGDGIVNERSLEGRSFLRLMTSITASSCVDSGHRKGDIEFLILTLATEYSEHHSSISVSASIRVGLKGFVGPCCPFTGYIDM